MSESNTTTEILQSGGIQAGAEEPYEKKAAADSGSRKALPWICRIFGMFCFAIVAATLLITVVPLKLGYSEYYVISGSMEPQVPIFSILYSRPVDPATLQAGDIASFKVGQTTVVHRVKINNVDKRSLVTKGDANDDVDFREISYDKVRGKVVKQYPVLGEVLMIYLTRCGKALLVVFAAAGILMFIVAHKMTEYSRNKKEKNK